MMFAYSALRIGYRVSETGFAFFFPFPSNFSYLPSLLLLILLFSIPSCYPLNLIFLSSLLLMLEMYCLLQMYLNLNFSWLISNPEHFTIFLLTQFRPVASVLLQFCNLDMQCKNVLWREHTCVRVARSLWKQGKHCRLLVKSIIFTFHVHRLIIK